MKKLLPLYIMSALVASSALAQTSKPKPTLEQLRRQQEAAQARRDAMTPAPSAPAKAEKKITDDPLWQDSEKVVKLLRKQGTLHRLDPQARKAWIDPMLWFALDADNKEKVTRAIAIYCMPMYPEITIYSAQSAKELASYGPFQGFKVE